MEQKRFVKVGLSTDNFRVYVGMMEEEVEDFMKYDPAFKVYQENNSTDWGKFDATDVLAQITILTASRTLQGKEVRSGLDKSFSELYNDLDGGLTPINFMFPSLPLESYRKRDRAQVKMSKFYIDILQKRKTGNADVCSNSGSYLPFSDIFSARSRYDVCTHEPKIPGRTTSQGSRDCTHYDCVTYGRSAHELCDRFLGSFAYCQQPRVGVSHISRVQYSFILTTCSQRGSI